MYFLGNNERIMTHTIEKNLTPMRQPSRRSMMFAALLFAHVCMHSQSVLAASASAAHWLAADISLIAEDISLRTVRESSNDLLNDELTPSLSTTQNIRAMMDPGISESPDSLVDAILTGQEIGAEQWIGSIPKAKQMLAQNSKPRVECQLNIKESRVECGKHSSISVATGDEAPRVELYGRELVARISREGVLTQKDHSLPRQKTPVVAAHDNSSTVVLVPRKDGLVTVAGGSIRFEKIDSTKKLILSEALNGVALSIFVRDPAVVTWNDSAGTLTAHKSGKSEVFVVTPGRISIIETHTPEDGVVALAAKSQSQGAGGLEMPVTLASLDGLDQAATKKSMLAANAGLSLQAQDLSVSDDVSKLGQSAIHSGAQFVRSKARANFESIRIKLVDDRSRQGGQQFPVSGVRVKIAGTEYSELSNNQGEVEVRDVPAGSRLLLDLSDERGYVMPQISEIAADADGVSRSIVQIIHLRRFASLDLAARSGGVVQDMQKSSLCGTVNRGESEGAGVRVSLDATATGPFYFNHLGFVDLRLGATTAGGKFCFFNVEPGPVAVGFVSAGRDEQLTGVIGLVAGRHAEESFDLSAAKHVSTTITTIASANEQLGSDEGRATRHDIVEQAEMYAVGSGQLMVPIEEGLMTTATAVLPMKGRVWTVSASSDFDTSVQAVPVRAPSSRQISTLIPNGFITDMAVFAQTTHNSDAGSVVVEHGNLSGATTDGTKMRLVDAFGRDVGDGWYFADHPVSKAVFFNVPAGIYALVVETATGHWIAADTVIVYSESVSVAKTGGQLEKISTTNQRASID